MIKYFLPISPFVNSKLGWNNMVPFLIAFKYLSDLFYLRHPFL